MRSQVVTRLRNFLRRLDGRERDSSDSERRPRRYIQKHKRSMSSTHAPSHSDAETEDWQNELGISATAYSDEGASGSSSSSSEQAYLEKELCNIEGGPPRKHSMFIVMKTEISISEHRAQTRTPEQ
ncbi:hypothetical protein AAL_06802 [Moelleriella libera RCEF 2490]|uniref:Uncharacterized protein n=1 Tax=Moelleriella libera RCEF 2490 TaxID=1081109 RepID=A0A167YAD9_9HYPO|nr:hypothetical protein AAL_06802 [Moelleriella libera RCEF 2490]